MDGEIRLVRTARLTLAAAVVAGMIVTAGPVAYYAVMRLVQFDLVQVRNLLLDDQNKLKLSRLGQAQLINLDRWPNREQVRVLTLRQAEFAFYSRVRYISHVDPRLVPFYSAGTVEQAFAELRQLGITHVSIPEEPLPTLYNSFLEEIVNSGRFVLRRDHFGNAVLCELLEKPLPPIQLADPIELPGTEWTPWAAVGKYAVRDGTYTRTDAGTAIFNRPMLSAGASEVRLSSGRGPIDVVPELSGSRSSPALTFGREYLLESEMRGEGLVLVEVHLYVDDSAPKVIPVWQGYLSGRNKPLRATFTQDAVSPRCTGCDTASARVVARLLSRGEVHVGRTLISESRFQGSSSSIERAQAERGGWALLAANPAVIRWGLAAGGQREVFVRHAGAYPVAVQSAAFGIPGGGRAPELAFEVRGKGRFFASLQCALDERSSAREISGDTSWLAGFIAAAGGAGQMPVTRDSGSTLQTAAGWATSDWTEVRARLQIPDCVPLGHGALVSRVASAGGSDNGEPVVHTLLRLTLTTRREADYQGWPEEFPDLEFRNIQVGFVSGAAESKESHPVVRL